VTDEARQQVERGAADAFEYVALTLTAGLSLSETLTNIARRARRAVGARRCVVDRLDGEDLVPLAEDDDGERAPSARVSVPLAPELRELLEGRPAFLLGQPHDRDVVPGEPPVMVIETAGVVPLRFAHELVGLMTLRWPDSPGLEPAHLLHLDAFGAYAALAIVTHQRAEEARRLRLARAVRALTARPRRAGPLVRDLDQLLAPDGLRVVGLAVAHEAARRHLGASTPTAEERAGWAAGQHVVLLPDGTTAVALVAGGRLVGSLRVRVEERKDDDEDRDADPAATLEAVADELALVVDRARLRAQARHALDLRAAQVERDQLVGEATRVAQHVLGAVEQLARHHLEDVRLPAATVPGFANVVELARRGHEETSRLLDAAALVPSHRRRLPQSLRALGQRAEQVVGIELIWHLRGTPVDLDPALERALYRIAAEAITVACRHGRCAVTRLDIDYRDDHVRLEVHDDGLPVHRRTPGDSRYLLMRRLAVGAGAALEVRNASPTGAIVSVRAPRRLAR
jgi:signal transduction histidine kinase